MTDSRLFRRTTVAILITSLFSLVPNARAADRENAESSKSWQVMYLSGQRVGYGRSLVREVTRDRETVVITESEEHMSIRRFGQKLNMQTKTRTEETPDGELQSYSFELKNPPAQTSKSVGRVDGTELVIESTVGGRTQTKRIAWDSSIKSPAWQDRVLRENPLEPGETRSIRTFMPQFAKPVDVRMTADDYRSVKLHDGTEKSLLKVRVSQSVLPGVGMRMYLDKEGEALRTEADLLGMVTYTVPREVALEKIAGAELDVAASTLIRPETLPVNLHDSSRAVYRIHTEDRDPSEFIPKGNTQNVTKIDDETAQISVVSRRPPKNIRPARREQQKYIDGTEFLQVDDRRVREHARKAAAGSIDPGTMAVRMEQYVYEELKKKNFSTALASAAEVARSLEGDCTEHACLLAAMLRAKKIPSRVAVGLVYSEQLAAFGGHMWTEAWLDGQWIPLDATRGQGGIGAGHIKLTDSSLADEGPAPVTSFLPLINVLSNVTLDVVSSK